MTPGEMARQMHDELKDKRPELETAVLVWVEARACCAIFEAVLAERERCMAEVRQLRAELAAVVVVGEPLTVSEQQVWDAAVAAERERAAKVAEAAVKCRCADDQFCEGYGCHTLLEVAAAIRKGDQG